MTTNTENAATFPELGLRAENPTTPQPLRIVPRRKREPFAALLESAKLPETTTPRGLVEEEPEWIRQSREDYRKTVAERYGFDTETCLANMADCGGL